MRLDFPKKLDVGVVGGATQPGGKTMLSPIVSEWTKA
jgi:hypothetical protein